MNEPWTVDLEALTPADQDARAIAVLDAIDRGERVAMRINGAYDGWVDSRDALWRKAGSVAFGLLRPKGGLVACFATVMSWMDDDVCIDCAGRNIELGTCQDCYARDCGEDGER